MKQTFTLLRRLIKLISKRGVGERTHISNESGAITRTSTFKRNSMNKCM